VRFVVLGAALLGGVCLVADLFVMADLLDAVGLVLVGLAVAGVGAGLARGPLLRIVCAAGSVALGWSVLQVLHDVADPHQVDAGVGGLATLCVAAMVLRGNHR
jgi:hypothetical protein